LLSQAGYGPVGVAAANVLLPHLLEFMLPECKPVAVRFRQYSKGNREFIQAEVGKQLAQGPMQGTNVVVGAQVSFPTARPDVLKLPSQCKTT